MKAFLAGVIAVVSLIFLLWYGVALNGVKDLRVRKSIHTMFGKEMTWFTKVSVENVGESTAIFVVDGVDYALAPKQSIEIKRMEKAESRTIYVRVAGLPLPAADIAFDF
jgi:hypothetical protein